MQMHDEPSTVTFLQNERATTERGRASPEIKRHYRRVHEHLNLQPLRPNVQVRRALPFFCFVKDTLKYRVDLFPQIQPMKVSDFRNCRIEDCGIVSKILSKAFPFKVIKGVDKVSDCLLNDFFFACTA